MGVINKFKGLIGLEEFEDEFEEEYEEYPEPERPYYERRKPDQNMAPSGYGGRSYNNNVISMQDKRIKAITDAFKLVVIEPQGFEECSRLVDSMKSRKPVIVNLEKLEPDLARKIFDFLGGATYALNGNVQKVANNIFVFAPENVAIAADTEHEPYNFTDTNEDYNPWK